jgi:homoserine O-succinyltransferase
LALAEQLGIAKSNYERKLFGVYELRTLEPEHALLRGSDDVFMCPQSRHAGIADAELERAAADGRVRLLAHGAASGYAVFEARDGRYLMHLGHPEYDAARLVYEYRRDVALGRTDVPVPAQLDLDNPITRWRSHRNQFFRNWLLNLRK